MCKLVTVQLDRGVQIEYCRGGYQRIEGREVEERGNGIQSFQFLLTKPN
jgi:hypothetical protein